MTLETELYFPENLKNILNKVNNYWVIMEAAKHFASSIITYNIRLLSLILITVMLYITKFINTTQHWL